jgi:hypothetical protein
MNPLFCRYSNPPSGPFNFYMQAPDLLHSPPHETNTAICSIYRETQRPASLNTTSAYTYPLDPVPHGSFCHQNMFPCPKTTPILLSYSQSILKKESRQWTGLQVQPAQYCAPNFRAVLVTSVNMKPSGCNISVQQARVKNWRLQIVPSDWNRLQAKKRREFEGYQHPPLPLELQMSGYMSK